MQIVLRRAWFTFAKVVVPAHNIRVVHVVFIDFRFTQQENMCEQAQNIGEVCVVSSTAFVLLCFIFKSNNRIDSKHLKFQFSWNVNKNHSLDCLLHEFDNEKMIESIPPLRGTWTSNWFSWERKHRILMISNQEVSSACLNWAALN